jgi:hypothetical protein
MSREVKVSKIRETETIPEEARATEMNAMKSTRSLNALLNFSTAS